MKPDMHTNLLAQPQFVGHAIPKMFKADSWANANKSLPIHASTELNPPYVLLQSWQRKTSAHAVPAGICRWSAVCSKIRTALRDSLIIKTERNRASKYETFSNKIGCLGSLLERKAHVALQQIENQALASKQGNSGFFPERVARVPVSLWGSGGEAAFAKSFAFVCATVRNHRQPSSTVCMSAVRLSLCADAAGVVQKVCQVDSWRCS